MKQSDEIAARNQLVAFTLDGQRYALRLPSIDRIVPMVEVTPAPKAPAIVTGLINWRGTIIPVLNIRKRFALRGQEPQWNDHLIIAHTSTRFVSFAVDSVLGVIEQRADDATPPEKIAPGIGYVDGVMKLEGDLLFICDLDRFLSLEEESRLADALDSPDASQLP